MGIKDGLTPDEADDFDRWVKHQRETNLKEMARSSMVISVYPTGEVDIEYAVQTGMAVLLDKPMLALVRKGAKLPSKFLRVADRVVEVGEDDVDLSSPALSAAVGDFISSVVDNPPAKVYDVSGNETVFTASDLEWMIDALESTGLYDVVGRKW